MKKTEATKSMYFRYPVRKKELLNRIYGENLPFLLSLLADKLIADKDVIQLQIPLEIEIPRKVCRYTSLTSELIENVKILLKKGGMKQRKIANVLHISEATVSNIKHKRYKSYEDKESGMVLEDNTSEER